MSGGWFEVSRLYWWWIIDMYGLFAILRRGWTVSHPRSQHPQHWYVLLERSSLVCFRATVYLSDMWGMVKMKTDAELIALVAQKLMGWHKSGIWWNDGPDLGSVRRKVDDWDPLTSDANACAVLDKMAEQDRVMQINYRDGCWDVWFSSNENMAGDWRSVERIRTPPGEGEPGDRRRAIVLAALKAVGVDIDSS